MESRHISWILIMTSVTAVQLDEDLTAKILDNLPEHMAQGRRMVEYLAKHPKSPTGYIAQYCSIGNLSDVASYLNPYLVEHGLMVGCEKPVVRVLNRHGESNQFIWSVYRVPEASNDGGQSSNDE
jgi:hypothetical protein